MPGNPVPRGHPIFLAEKYFVAGMDASPHKIDVNVDGLAKLLMFGDYVRANGEGIEAVVGKEAGKYPYRKHKTFQVRKQNY